MYEIIKNVIQAGSFDLPSILKKIDTFWVKGQLTDEQRDELIELARGGAQFDQSVDILAKMANLDARVRALEENNAIVVNPSVDVNTIQEYEAGKWYYKDDVVKFKDKVYTCTAPEGQVCVWSPEDYPNYWVVIE